VDTAAVLIKIEQVVISLHCWQTDDVGGFETADSSLSGGGIQATGNYPGKSRNIAEMRADLEKVMSLLPGKQRLNLHAICGEFGGEKIDRDQIEVKHFQGWINWCKAAGIGMDFNPTCFSHPKAADGFILSSENEEYRRFWVEHVRRCRAISAEIGKQLETPCVQNTWVPDGSKDIPVDRNGYRALLKKSLDEAMAAEYPKEYMKDAVESKLFGIGAYVIGTRAVQKAFLIALLELSGTLGELERQGKNFERLAMLEELKTMPFSAVWDYYCMQEGVPAGMDYISEIQNYETEVLSKR